MGNLFQKFEISYDDDPVNFCQNFPEVASYYNL